MKLKMQSEASKKLIKANNVYVAALREFGKKPSREVDELCFEAKAQYMKAHCEFYIAEIEPNLNAYKKPLAPLRPSNLPSNDGELIEELYKARGIAYSNKRAKVMAMFFGAWRSAVMNAEGISARNIIFLLRFTRSLHEMNYQPELTNLFKFLFHEYGVNTPHVCETEKEITDVAWGSARRRDILPDCLLEEEKPALKLETRNEYEDPQGVGCTFNFEG
jgi:hypothetical protein